MSAFYDLASLVLVPSGYKASKVYAQKPLTTDGQLSFSRASTATRVNSAGLIETVASNVPRLDYLNSSCPRLLLEPQRTNLALYSENFDNAVWTKLNSTVSANQTQDPSGYVGADKLVQTSDTAEHSIYNTITVASGTTYTASVFLKIGDGSKSWPYAQVRFRNGGFGTGGGVVADLLNGTISYSSGLTSSSIQSYGNGWYRISITQAASVNSASAGVVVAFNDTSNSFSVVFAGDTNANMFLFGATIEAGAYATSYVNTLNSAVTRGADAASKTGISSLIGQTEGTLFLDFVPQSKDFQIFYQVRTTGSTNVGQIDIRYQSSNLRALGTDAGASQFNIAAGDIVVGQRYKCAVRYQLNNVAFYVNGSLASTDLSATFSSSTKQQVSFNENLNSFLPQALVNQALLFPTALSNAQLAELTA